MERFHRLAHSVWDCKYHIVWIPKYRRKELYGAKKQIVIDTIKQWFRNKMTSKCDGFVKSQHFDGFVKCSRSRLANPEE